MMAASLTVAQPLTIYLIAPSGFPADAAAVERGLAWLRTAGHTVVNTKCLARRDTRFAGTDAQRIAELNALATLPDGVDLVLAVRGGYGLTRLLPQLDLAGIAARIEATQLPVVGHSDFTALQLALLAHGAGSLAGPMLAADFGAAAPSPWMLEQFSRALSGANTIAVAGDDGGLAAPVSGPLWGGNLALVASLVGTPWLPAVDGGILFLEDIGEHPYRIERMLIQLLQAGILARQRAILLGDFRGYALTDVDAGYDFDAVVGWLRSHCRAPVLTGLPFGHLPDKATLPVGTVATAAPTTAGWQLAWRR